MYLLVCVHLCVSACLAACTCAHYILAKLSLVWVDLKLGFDKYKC